MTGLDWAALSSPAPPSPASPVLPFSMGLLVDAGWRSRQDHTPSLLHPNAAERLGAVTAAPLLPDRHGTWKGPCWHVLHHSPGTGQGSWQEKVHGPAGLSLLTEERAQLWCFAGNLASVFSSVQVVKWALDKSRCFA